MRPVATGSEATARDDHWLRAAEPGMAKELVSKRKGQETAIGSKATAGDDHWRGAAEPGNLADVPVPSSGARRSGLDKMAAEPASKKPSLGGAGSKHKVPPAAMGSRVQAGSDTLPTAPSVEHTAADSAGNETLHAQGVPSERSAPSCQAAYEEVLRLPIGCCYRN